MNINWLLTAIIGQLLFALAALIDKILLKGKILSPLSYAFWVGILGLFALFLVPFGFKVLPVATMIAAALSGATFVFGFLFYFYALHRAELSQAVPMLAGLVPLFAYIVGSFLFNIPLGVLDVLGFSLLFLGSIFFSLGEAGQWRAFFIVAAFASGILLGASSALAKTVFLQANFISGFVWIKLWGVLAAFAFLLSRKARSEIVGSWRQKEAPWLFIAGRVAAALGSFAVYFAVFGGHPALVESTQVVRHALVFIVSWLVLRETFRGRVLIFKIAGTVLVALGLGTLALGEYAKSLPPISEERPIIWGVTFSEKFSRELGLDWRANYLAILDELAPQRLRLIAYWDLIEKERGRLNFSSLDWQVEEAERRGIPIILAFGLKVPRWPECHVPAWAKVLPKKEMEEALMSYLRGVVEHYFSRRGISIWQVENEPFLAFGECSALSPKLVDKEIALLRSLDYSRPILLTDGGEFGLWLLAAKRGDIFGTTMYRKVYPKVIGPLFGVIQYPISPDYFRLKEKIIRFLGGIPDKRFIVIELQGEPWLPHHLGEISFEEAFKNFSPTYFVDTINYAKRSGFDEFYLWGAEWWWWMKEKHGRYEYWNYAKTLYRH
jgi:drug/metabolite transporter (DMT)-like permease